MDRTWLAVPCPLLLHFVLMRLIITVRRMQTLLLLKMKKLKIFFLGPFTGPLSTEARH